MSNVLVSICIPTYNGAQYIAEAMESAIAQTYDNLEIIVSDDASKDETLSIINGFKDKTEISISIYNHEPNGIGANWNNSIKQAQGKYIKLLFQDDVLFPTCIEKMVEVLETDPTVGLVACKRELIYDENYVTPELLKWVNTYEDLQKGFDKFHVNNKHIIDKSAFKEESFFNKPLNKIGEPPAVLFSKKNWKYIGEFREDLKQILDYEYYTRILKFKKIVVLDEKLIAFRLHKEQATNVNRINKTNDFIVYDRIKYDKYFWLLSMKDKIKYLKKYNTVVKILIKIKRKFISFLSKIKF